MIVTVMHWYLGTKVIFPSLEEALKKYSIKRSDCCKSELEIHEGIIRQRFTHPVYRIECVETLDNIFQYLENNLIPIATQTDYLGRLSPLVWPPYSTRPHWRPPL